MDNPKLTDVMSKDRIRELTAAWESTPAGDADTPVSDLVHQLLDLREQHEAASEEVKRLKASLERAEDALIDAMMDADMSSVTIAGKRITLAEQLWARPAKGSDDADTVTWLNQHGLGACAATRINTQSLSAAFREAQETGVYPDDWQTFVAVSKRPQVRINKA